MQLVQRAIEYKRAEAKDAKRGRGRPHDQIWCVFDRDEHPHFDEAVKLAMDHGIHVAMSNPCIELWFVLHFEDRTAFLDRREAQHRATELLGCGKVLAPAAVDALIGRFHDAARRARKLDAKHAGDGSPPGSNPSTGVWRLVEEIRKGRPSS